MKKAAKKEPRGGRGAENGRPRLRLWSSRQIDERIEFIRELLERPPAGGPLRNIEIAELLAARFNRSVCESSARAYIAEARRDWSAAPDRLRGRPRNGQASEKDETPRLSNEGQHTDPIAGHDTIECSQAKACQLHSMTQSQAAPEISATISKPIREPSITPEMIVLDVCKDVIIGCGISARQLHNALLPCVEQLGIAAVIQGRSKFHRQLEQAGGGARRVPIRMSGLERATVGPLFIRQLTLLGPRGLRVVLLGRELQSGFVSAAIFELHVQYPFSEELRAFGKTSSHGSPKVAFAEDAVRLLPSAATTGLPWSVELPKGEIETFIRATQTQLALPVTRVIAHSSVVGASRCSTLDVADRRPATEPFQYTPIETGRHLSGEKFRVVTDFIVSEINSVGAQDALKQRIIEVRRCEEAARRHGARELVGLSAIERQEIRLGRRLLKLRGTFGVRPRRGNRGSVTLTHLRCEEADRLPSLDPTKGAANQR